MKEQGFKEFGCQTRFIKEDGKYIPKIFMQKTAMSFFLFPLEEVGSASLLAPKNLRRNTTAMHYDLKAIYDAAQSAIILTIS